MESEGDEIKSNKLLDLVIYHFFSSLSRSRGGSSGGDAGGAADRVINQVCFNLTTFFEPSSPPEAPPPLNIEREKKNVE